MKKNFLKLSLITLISGLITLLIAYFFFHFVTDEGITFVFHEEAGKPFVTQLIADFGVLNLFASFITFLIATVFYKKETSKS